MKRLLCLCIACMFIYTHAGAQKNMTDATTAITALMNKSAEDWNKADLDAFMETYDTAATFMFSTGPVGLGRMRENYEKGFFKDGKPLQQLRYDDLVVRPLGEGYALLTGKFVLYGNGRPDRKGIYTLVFVKRGTGWKILHDHSS